MIFERCLRGHPVQQKHFQDRIRQRVGRCWHVVKRCQNSFFFAHEARLRLCRGQYSLRGLLPGQKPDATRNPFEEVAVTKHLVDTTSFQDKINNLSFIVR